MTLPEQTDMPDDDRAEIAGELLGQHGPTDQTTTTLYVRIPTSLHARVAEIARVSGVSMAVVAAAGLQRGLADVKRIAVGIELDGGF